MSSLCENEIILGVMPEDPHGQRDRNRLSLLPCIIPNPLASSVPARQCTMNGWHCVSLSARQNCRRCGYDDAPLMTQHFKLIADMIGYST